MPQGADFNLSIHAWSVATATPITRREFGVLKLLYFTHLARDNSDTPPMLPATDENVLSLFSALAAQPGSK